MALAPGFLLHISIYINPPLHFSLFHISHFTFIKNSSDPSCVWYICCVFSVVMTLEASLVEKNEEVIRRANKIIRKKKLKRRSKVGVHNGSISVSLQKLYLACKDVFQGPGTVPSSQDVQKLQHILDGMKPEDVGLSSDMVFFNPRHVVKGTPSVTYTTIYQCKNFSLCIFFLPPTALIPLHNHPEMTVFNKLLLGSMHIKSYDWVDPCTSDESPSSQLRLARMKENSVFTAPCNTSVLYPTSGGNIHAFKAVKACAVLDVLGPPYSKDDGRDCTYYREFPYSICSDGVTTRDDGNGEDGSYGWLEEIEAPKDLQMDRIHYMGPQIIETC